VTALLASARARAAVLLVVAAAAFGATPAYAGTAALGGTVTDAVSGDPVSGVCVSVWKEEGDTAYTVADSCTETDGQWSAPDLDAGIYYVQASGPDWVTQFAYGKTYSWDAERFTVADGDAVTVDLAMQPAGSIAGTVTNAITGDPAADICVSAQSGDASGNACTGEDGTYVITGLAAASDYTVFFTDYSGTYSFEYAHDTDNFDLATRFEVVAGETTQVDESLQPAAAISGTVTDATTGDPVAGVCMVASSEPESFDGVGFACTEEDGTYRMTGIADGDYYVSGEDSNGAHPRTWHPSTADPAAAVSVHATAGQDTTVDLSLSPAAYLTGTITRASTGEPLAGVCAYAVRPSDGAFLRAGGQLTCSDENGAYTIGGVPTGNVKVFFGPSDNELLAQWAYGKDTEATASLVPADAGQTTSGVDAAMRDGGRISGRITDAKSKKPVEGACATVGVYSHRAGENGTQWASACTGADGKYEIHGLPTGSYQVEFYDPDGTWAWEFFPGKGDRVQAAKLSVTAGSTLSGINAKLVPGGTVRGTVTDSTTGQPAENVCVDAFTARGQNTFGTTAQTFADGTYVLRGFPSTKVKVSFFDCGGGYAPEWAFDKATYDTATPIATTAGKAVTANETVSPG
jgi:5-hydroxyisourate hydrolase-like protein (transthyretin family)